MPGMRGRLSCVPALPQQRNFVYRIAVLATLAYIGVFVSASLAFITAFFTVALVSTVVPVKSAWAETLSITSAPVKQTAKASASRGIRRKATRIASASSSRKHGSPTRLLQRGWDRNLNAHPARGMYKRSFRVIATAYSPVNTLMEGGRYTFTERDGRAVHGIAVDPRLIPIGSQLWIPGYGHAVADDTGGRIRGHHVDVRIQDYDRMLQWGCRKLQIYVISDGSDSATKKAAARHLRRV